MTKQDPQELILNAGLEELLGGHAPPDLSEPILQQWAQKLAGGAAKSGSSSNGSHANGNGASAAEAQQHDHDSVVPQVSPRAVKPYKTKAADRRRAIVWTVATTAGVLLVGSLIAVILNSQDPPSAPIAEQPADDPGSGSDDRVQVQPLQSDTNLAQQPTQNDEPQRSVFDDPPPFEVASSNPPPRGPERPQATVAAVPEDDITAAIGDLIARSWQVAEVAPSPAADDGHWCRRVYLRLLGRTPTVDELMRFEQDTAADKRAQLVTRIMSDSQYRDEFAAHWATIWANWLIGRRGGSDAQSLASREGMILYLKSAWEQHTPYDKLVFELISATGSARPEDPDFNGATNFMLANYGPKATRATARTARVFLGRQLQCAQCHNHPSAELQQADFWQFNAFLRQMKPQRDPQTKSVRLVNVDFLGEGKNSQDGELYYELPNGTVKVAYPAYAGAEVPRSGRIAEFDRRSELARRVAESPELVEAVVNRMWAHFLGFGLTRPFDDLGSHNPSNYPELSQYLSEQFVAHDYNLQALIRWIVLSDPFGRSSEIVEGNLADAPEAGNIPLFSRYYVRQLEPEAVYQSLVLAANSGNQTLNLIQQIQAQQTWMEGISTDMGNDEGDEVHAFDGGIRQSLLMMNGPLMRQATDLEEGSLLNRVVNSDLSAREKIDHLFLAAVARTPTDREWRLAQQMIRARGDDLGSALQDIWWALLNSNEFILDH